MEDTRDRLQVYRSPNETGLRPESYIHSKKANSEKANGLPEPFADQLKKQITQAEDFLVSSVEKNPLLCLGAALTAGFLAGHLIQKLSKSTDKSIRTHFQSEHLTH